MNTDPASSTPSLHEEAAAAAAAVAATPSAGTSLRRRQAEAWRHFLNPAETLLDEAAADHSPTLSSEDGYDDGAEGSQGASGYDISRRTRALHSPYTSQWSVGEEDEAEEEAAAAAAVVVLSPHGPQLPLVLANAHRGESRRDDARKKVTREQPHRTAEKAAQTHHSPAVVTAALCETERPRLEAVDAVSTSRLQDSSRLGTAALEVPQRSGAPQSVRHDTTTDVMGEAPEDAASGAEPTPFVGSASLGDNEGAALAAGLHGTPPSSALSVWHTREAPGVSDAKRSLMDKASSHTSPRGGALLTPVDGPAWHTPPAQQSRRFLFTSASAASLDRPGSASPPPPPPSPPRPLSSSSLSSHDVSRAAVYSTPAVVVWRADAVAGREHSPGASHQSGGPAALRTDRSVTPQSGPRSGHTAPHTSSTAAAAAFSSTHLPTSSSPAAAAAAARHTSQQNQRRIEWATAGATDASANNSMTMAGGSAQGSPARHGRHRWEGTSSCSAEESESEEEEDDDIFESGGGGGGVIFRLCLAIWLLLCRLAGCCAWCPWCGCCVQHVFRACRGLCGCCWRWCWSRGWCCASPSEAAAAATPFSPDDPVYAFLRGDAEEEEEEEGEEGGASRPLLGSHSRRLPSEENSGERGRQRHQRQRQQERGASGRKAMTTRGAASADREGQSPQSRRGSSPSSTSGAGNQRVAPPPAPPLLLLADEPDAQSPLLRESAEQWELHFNAALPSYRAGVDDGERDGEGRTTASSRHNHGRSRLRPWGLARMRLSLSRLFAYYNVFSTTNTALYRRHRGVRRGKRHGHPPPPSTSFLMDAGGGETSAAPAAAAVAATSRWTLRSLHSCTAEVHTADAAFAPPADAGGAEEMAGTVRIPAIGQVFVLLHYVALLVLTVTVVVLAAFEFSRTLVAEVRDATACNRFPYRDVFRPDFSFSLICFFLNGLLATRYAVRAVREEKDGLLVVQAVTVVLQVCRAAYFLCFVADRYLRHYASLGAPPTTAAAANASSFSSFVDFSSFFLQPSTAADEAPNSEVPQRLFPLLLFTWVGILTSVSLFFVASLLLPWVYASFGWRRYAQGIVSVALARVRQRLSTLQTCVQLDRVITLNAYLATVFLLDTWQDQRELLAVVAVVLFLHAVLVPWLRRAQHWWPLLVAVFVLLAVTGYSAALIGGSMQRDYRLRTTSSSPWYSACYTDQLPGCLADISPFYPVTVYRDRLTRASAVTLHPVDGGTAAPGDPAIAGKRADSNTDTTHYVVNSAVPLSHGDAASVAGSLARQVVVPAPPFVQIKGRGSASEGRYSAAAQGAVEAPTRTHAPRGGAASRFLLHNDTDTYLPTHGAFPDYFRIASCDEQCFAREEEATHQGFVLGIARCCGYYGQCRLKDAFRTYAVILLILLTTLSYLVRVGLLGVAWRRVVGCDDAVIEAFLKKQRRERQGRASRRRPSTSIDDGAAASQRQHGVRRADGESTPHRRGSSSSASSSSRGPHALTRLSQGEGEPARSQEPPPLLIWNVEQYCVWRNTAETEVRSEDHPLMLRRGDH